MKTHARRGIRTATGLIIAVAGSAQASDLKDYITGTASGSVAADFYWPLENSFLSDLQTTAGRIRALGYEANGIYENDCTPPNAAPDPDVFRLVDYFPILPDHMTRAARSTALIFGETTGDLGPAMGDQVDRYLEFDFSDYTLQPMTFLGLHHQDEWTIHMVVSPDADDEDERGWETLFDVGDLYYTGVSGITIKPIRITLDADRQDGQTVFRIKTEAEGAPVRTASVTVSDATLTPVNGRPWYQVIAQYYQPGPSDPHRVRIIVHTITDGLLGNVTRTQAGAESDEWRHDAGGSARMGLDLEGDNPFHGAIHHFAIWKSSSTRTTTSSTRSARSPPPSRPPTRTPTPATRWRSTGTPSPASSSGTAPSPTPRSRPAPRRTGTTPSGTSPASTPSSASTPTDRTSATATARPRT